MRILIEHGSSELNNLGDLAMLQVAIERLRELWPEAELSVIVRSKEPLRIHAPTVKPVVIQYPQVWSHLRNLVAPVTSLLPDHWRPILEGTLSRRVPASYKRTLAGAAERADIVIHAGAGILADPFVPAALRRLALFDHAAGLGKPTAFFGQGMGPLRSSVLLRAVKSTLAQVDWISTRDPISASLLGSLLDRGEHEIPMTGDDALELAFRHRKEVLGNGLGINVRVANFSGLTNEDPETLDKLERAIGSPPGRGKTQVIPFTVHPSDLAVTRDIVKQAATSRLEDLHAPTVPALIEAISGCRLVISARYHGAVLALGQGIPAICLHKTAYYQQKFTGLAQLFPQDCRLVDLSDPIQTDGLQQLAESMHDQAPDRRPALLRRVSEYLDRSRSAYRQFREVAERK